MSNASLSNFKPIGFTIALCFGLLLLGSCKNTEKLEREFFEPDHLISVSQADTFLKAHLNGGHLLVFDKWQLDMNNRILHGQGAELDLNRDTIHAGDLITNLDSVAIFETNKLRPSNAVATLGVLTGIIAAVGIYCATSPKTCFGSCPTFYVPDGDSLVLRAEGFSSSIAPSLEKTDIDRLEPVEIHGDELTITMTNEALETHVVRHVNVLAVPKTSDTFNVFRDTEGMFYESDHIIAPASCKAPEGNCLEKVRQYDDVERFSLSDSTNLISKEWIELSFDGLSDGNIGLVLGLRQSLMSTFLLYQTLAYMGEDVGFWLAKLERSGLPQADPMQQLLQEVAELEVYVEEKDGTRSKIGGVSEYGPLVSDVHLLKVPFTGNDSTKIYLRLNKGYWRLDYAALVSLSTPLSYQRLKPNHVANKNKLDEDALDNLLDSESTLVTFPGDRYEISFQLSETPHHYAYFLESKGYYLEWIRQEWLADENQEKLRQIFLDPASAMKDLAPAFKNIEAIMEKAFWSSRYATN